MKPTSTFKFKGSYKRLIDTIVDPHKRGHLKRMLIDAQLESEVRPAKEK